jgi:hypothetical protein
LEFFQEIQRKGTGFQFLFGPTHGAPVVHDFFEAV